MRRRQKNHLRTVSCAVSDAETQAAYIAPGTGRTLQNQAMHDAIVESGMWQGKKSFLHERWVENPPTPEMTAKRYKFGSYTCHKCGKVMKFLTNTHKRKCDAVIS